MKIYISGIDFDSFEFNPGSIVTGFISKTPQNNIRPETKAFVSEDDFKDLSNQLNRAVAIIKAYEEHLEDLSSSADDLYKMRKQFITRE